MVEYIFKCKGSSLCVQHLFCLSFEQVHGRTVNVWLSQGAFNFVYVPYSKYTILLSL